MGNCVVKMGGEFFSLVVAGAWFCGCASAATAIAFCKIVRLLTGGDGDNEEAVPLRDRGSTAVPVPPAANAVSAPPPAASPVQEVRIDIQDLRAPPPAAASTCTSVPEIVHIEDRLSPPPAAAASPAAAVIQASEAREVPPQLHHREATLEVGLQKHSVKKGEEGSTSKAQSTEPQPPLVHEGVGAVSKSRPADSISAFPDALIQATEAREVPPQLHHREATLEVGLQKHSVEKGDDISNPDLLSMDDGLATSKAQSSEPQPPVVNEGAASVTNKVEGEVFPNEVSKSKPADWVSGFPAVSDGRLQIIKNNDLEELQELGSGTFGTVYHGKWRGTDVAIKRINDRCFAGKPSEQEKMRSDFWNEASNLADLHHPNVVAFYGVVLDGPGGSIATVTEYMVNGSLRTALLKNAKTLDRRKRLIIAMDTAFGMEYLHSKNIVHFDLKSDNLLVNLRDPQRPICKVGDLGLSKVKCQTLISGGVRGTLPWMAPELLNGSSSLVSEKVDVFSFGIVLWELLTGEEPYADLHYGVIIGGIVSNTLRPQVPDSCDPEWRSLMEQCWSTEPSERPNFTEIANRLRSMAASQKVQH